MFGDTFEHYLSYGATDQRTVREVREKITGLLIPGTIAAFQQDGTGGFVLTLSAHTETPYAIDPRFPLFQQRLQVPKKSHRALAEILGVGQLISEDTDPAPEDFSDEIIVSVAQNWSKFNLGYKTNADAKFTKYAKRLGEELDKQQASGPCFVLAPYFIADGVEDVWWSKSERLYEGTLEHCGQESCVRVVAAKTSAALGPLLNDLAVDRAAIWVNGLNEVSSPAQDLSAYGAAIRQAQQADVQTFALYGGFFSVLLSSVGLGGSSHGIGYGEHREYLELPQSGPPPARYYLPQLHRYVSQELAFKLWQADPSLAKCDCEICQGDAPVSLDYHQLMKHSVLCRAAEIDKWTNLEVSSAKKRLIEERARFLDDLYQSDATDIVTGQAIQSAGHMQVWIDSLAQLETK